MNAIFEIQTKFSLKQCTLNFSFLKGPQPNTHSANKNVPGEKSHWTIFFSLFTQIPEGKKGNGIRAEYFSFSCLAFRDLFSQRRRKRNLLLTRGNKSERESHFVG